MAKVANSDEEKTKKPSNAAWKQQKLSACKPVWSGKLVAIVFGVVGLIYITIGIPLYTSVDEAEEITLDYTDCEPVYPVVINGTNYATCAKFLEDTAIPTRLKDRNLTECICTVKFNVSTNFDPTVYMYYRLTNFYQNHRRYVSSRDDNQLDGDPREVSSECDPYESSHDGLPYAPCGMIANSLFNDSLTLFYKDKSSGEEKEVNLTRTGIAWSSDKDTKFSNPGHASSISDLCEAFRGTAHPPSWNISVCNLSDDVDNSGFVNEDLIVWMRTAAFPTFRKLYAKLYDGMSTNREYRLNIRYNFPVSAFDGTKSVVFGTTSVVGGRNFFLPIAYLAVGSILVTLSAVFAIIHLFVERKRDAGYWKRVREFK